MLWRSTVAFATLLALANASPSSPVSDAEIQGIICGIQTYGNASLWGNDQLQIVRDTMAMKDNGYYGKSGAS